MLRGEWGDQLLFSCGRNLVLASNATSTSFHYEYDRMWLYYYKVLQVRSQLRISQTETSEQAADQAANKFPTTSVLFNVGIVEIHSCNSLYVE